MSQDETWFAPVASNSGFCVGSMAALVAAFAAGAVGLERAVHGTYRMQEAALIKQSSTHTGRGCVSKALWHGGFDMLRALRKSPILRRVFDLKINKNGRKTLPNK